ncbi:MAG: GNAT family N-acetyltransferase [Lachnospiraceae bacterium]
MIELVENKLDVDTYLKLRDAVSWKKLGREQAQKALDNSLYIAVAYEEGKPVGMGRIVGDGAVICYVQDLIVIPDMQQSGIGGILIERLKEVVKDFGYDNTTMMFALMCAKGREKFYEKHNFIARPTTDLGPGMIQYLQIKKA